MYDSNPELEPEGTLTAKEQQFALSVFNDERIPPRMRFQFGALLAGGLDSVYIRLNWGGLAMVRDTDELKYVVFQRVSTGLVDVFISRSEENVQLAKTENKKNLGKALEYPSEAIQAFDSRNALSLVSIKRLVNFGRINEAQARMLCILPYSPPKDRDTILKHVRRGKQLYETTRAFAEENKLFTLIHSMDETSEDYKRMPLYYLSWTKIFTGVLGILLIATTNPSIGFSIFIGAIIAWGLSTGTSVYQRMRDMVLFELLDVWQPVPDDAVEDIPSKGIV